MALSDYIFATRWSTHLFIEGFRRTRAILPHALYWRFENLVNHHDAAWSQLGMRQRPLAGTPYQIKLHLGYRYQRWTYIHGRYPEPHITALLQATLRPGDVFVDVGANIGVHTLLAAHCVGPEGMVIAIEPNPHSYRLLRDNMALNRLDWVTTHEMGLGRERGTAQLSDGETMSVLSNLRGTTSDAPGGSIRIARGDDLLQQIPSTACGICKIDVEGYELEALHGMTDFLATHPHMAYIVEVTDSWLRELGGSAQALFDLFAAHTFAAHQIRQPDGDLRPLTAPLDGHQYDAWFASQPN